MQAIEAIPLFRTRPSGAAAVTAKEAAQSFAITFDDTPATPPTGEPLQPDQLAYYQQFAGQVVNDDTMFNLYLSAHKNGFRLTSQPHGGMGCDHTVTSARFW
jgi:hypothetical protein